MPAAILPRSAQCIPPSSLEERHVGIRLLPQREEAFIQLARLVGVPVLRICAGEADVATTYSGRAMPAKSTIVAADVAQRPTPTQLVAILHRGRENARLGLPSMVRTHDEVRDSVRSPSDAALIARIVAGRR